MIVLLGKATLGMLSIKQNLSQAWRHPTLTETCLLMLKSLQAYLAGRIGLQEWSPSPEAWALRPSLAEAWALRAVLDAKSAQDPRSGRSQAEMGLAAAADKLQE